MAVEDFRTLGELLAQLAQRMSARRVPRFSWLRPLAAMLDHVTDRPIPAVTRYARVEAPISAIHVIDQPGARAAAPDTQPAAAPPRPALAGASTGPMSIPASVRARLDELLGTGAGAARVHTDEAANRMAEAQRADAVTVGPDIYFRHGAYRPHDDRGFALLTHEVVHVLRAMSPDAAWRRATARGVAEEEESAAAAEAGALRHRRHGHAWPPPDVGAPGRVPTATMLSSRLPGMSAHPATPPPAPTSAPAAAAAQRPMAALSDRSPDPSSAVPPATVDVDELRRTIYRDLMRQIKTDFERGG